MTPIAETIYSGPTGAGTLPNPFSASVVSDVEFWMEKPKRLDLYVTYPNLSPRRITVEAQRPQLERFENHIFDYLTEAQIDDSRSFAPSLYVTTRVQACIDDTWDAGGGTVLMPIGGFKIGNLVLPTGNVDTTDRCLALVGQFDNTSGEPKTARRRYGTRLLFSLTNGSDCIAALSSGGTWPKYRFENFTIEGPDTEATALSGHGIRVTGGSSAHVTIRNVELTHFRGGAGFRLGTVLGGLLENAFAQYCKYGFYLDATFNGNVIINPYTQACTDVGLYCTDAATLTVIGGIIQSSLKTGVYLEAVGGVRFLGTYFENNNSSNTAGEYAFKVDAPSSGRGSSHIKLDGCRFSDVRDKVFLSGVSGGTVTATTIEGGYNSGVADPKIIINNAFVANTRVIEAAPLASITDNGSNTRIEYGGVTILRGGSVSAPALVVGGAATCGQYAIGDGWAISRSGVRKIGVDAVGFSIGATGNQISAHYSATATWDPPSLNAGAQTTTTVAVTGALLGDTVTVGFNKDLQGMQLTAYVSAAGTVTVVLQNGTAGTIDLASGTLRVDVWQH